MLTEPRTEFVTKAANRFFVGGPSCVTVGPGVVDVEPLLGGRIRQRKPLVYVVWSRLLQPRLPRIELIDDESGRAVYLAPFLGDYRLITQALERAGFVIRQRTELIAPC
jgi:hypothetical protein